MAQMTRRASFFDLDDQLPIGELPEELRLAEFEIGREVVENTCMSHPASRVLMDGDEWDDTGAENADRFIFS